MIIDVGMHGAKTIFGNGLRYRMITITLATKQTAMKCFWLTPIVLFFCTGMLCCQQYNPGRTYSVAELRDDFRLLRDSLEKKHPNLYLYTPKTAFDIFFDSLYNSITQPLTDLEFYHTITLLNAKIKNGHTMLLPGDSTMAWLNHNGKFFPFYVRVAGNHLYVNMNCSRDTAIQEGTEIVSINGINAPAILQTLLQRKIRDGYNTTYPVWILDNYFKEYYGFSFGHPLQFSVSLKSSHSQIINRVVNAVSKDSIRYNRNKRYSSRVITDMAGKGITLDLHKVRAYAVLTIRDFDSDNLKSNYNQEFKRTIDSLFNQIMLSNIKNLILDLRDNQGGNFANGQLLLSYLLGKPFKLLIKGEATEMVQPKEKRFSGKLYILINGGSFSNTAIVCSRLAYYKRAVFIGEETGGNNTVISGFSDDETTGELPNTKINCAIPNMVFTIRDDISNAGHGTMPDYNIVPTITDIINNNDTVRKFAVGLIMKNIK
jgi:hypothetical protein